MFALPAFAARLRRIGPMITVSALMVSMPLAEAQQYQQYPPPNYPSPAQPPGYPGAAPPPAYNYPEPGYGGPGAPPPLQQEVVPPPPGAAMVWQPGYWSWGRHGWVWVSGRYVGRPYPQVRRWYAPSQNSHSYWQARVNAANILERIATVVASAARSVIAITAHTASPKRSSA